MSEVSSHRAEMLVVEQLTSSGSLLHVQLHGSLKVYAIEPGSNLRNVTVSSGCMWLSATFDRIIKLSQHDLI